MKGRWVDSGFWYHADTALDLLAELKREDWSAPNSVMDFKLNVARRVQVMGVTLLFWDATSFLMSMVEAGFIVVDWELEKPSNQTKITDKKKDIV